MDLVATSSFLCLLSPLLRERLSVAREASETCPPPRERDVVTLVIKAYHSEVLPAQNITHI